MKVIVLVTVVVMALSQVTGQSCFNRSMKKGVIRPWPDTKCQPHLSLVQLPVPEGFDSVEPSVIKIKQCTGLACTFPHSCLPIPESITKKTFTVKAKKTPILREFFVTVEVEEHNACDCGCPTVDCDEGMVFNKEECRCECDPRLEEACAYRRVEGEHVMWSLANCACLCFRSIRCVEHDATENSTHGGTEDLGAFVCLDQANNPNSV